MAGWCCTLPIWAAPGNCPRANCPSGAAEHFDFQALAVRPSTEQSQRCWVAGSPGTRVFFSGDGGRTWQVGNTGQTLPIRDLTFVDDWHGWAVGDLGLILSTEDGGRTWQRQQSGGPPGGAGRLLRPCRRSPLGAGGPIVGGRRIFERDRRSSRGRRRGDDGEPICPSWRTRRRGRRRQRGRSGLAVSGARVGLAAFAVAD